MDYLEETKICEYLGLGVRGDQVYAYYGLGFRDGGRNPTGWQTVCHVSKLKMYLGRKIHKEHYKNTNGA